MNPQVKMWLHGLVAALIGGLANAMLGWVANLSPRQFEIMTLGNICLTVGAYLKSAPDPWDPTQTDRRNPPGVP